MLVCATRGELGEVPEGFLSDGETLTSVLPGSIGLATGPDGTKFVYQQLALGVGELVYGLGERFGPLVKNGQTIDQARPYVMLALGVGVHFDIFGK